MELLHNIWAQVKASPLLKMEDPWQMHPLQRTYSICGEDLADIIAPWDTYRVVTHFAAFIVLFSILSKYYDSIGEGLLFLASSALFVTVTWFTYAVPYFAAFYVWSPFWFPRVLVNLLQPAEVAFIFWFLYRYWRFNVHLVSFFRYESAPTTSTPLHTPKDVSVIIPTVEPHGKVFEECIGSICENEPAAIFIATVGAEGHRRALKTVNDLNLKEKYPKTDIQVVHTNEANKRRQVASVLDRITTLIVVPIDSTVFWGPLFLAAILPCFSSERVGLVGTNKRVRMETPGGFGGLFWKNFDWSLLGDRAWDRWWNIAGAVYLSRHNQEIQATTSADGGIFAVSGRTSAIRTSILKNGEFLKGYLDEKFFRIPRLIGGLGPVVADDDNYITRFCYYNDMEVRIQYSDEARIETVLGTWPRFISQALRWARTTYRSNPASLLMNETWERQPWSIYAVYTYQCWNFSTLHDTALYFLFEESRWSTNKFARWALFCWIFFTRLTKFLPHAIKNPRDASYFGHYLIFGWVHGIIKLWALMTFWSVAWSDATSP